MPRAESVLKKAEARYTAGDTSLSEVLPIRREYLDARLAYLDSLRSALQSWAVLSAFLEGVAPGKAD